MMRRLFSIPLHPLAALRALARDQRGNTFALIAAALIPMLAAIGSGVDISRAYMAQSRLQGAVDSAALAGRRSRIGTGMAEATQAADQFLAFNYPKTSYGGKEADWSSEVTSTMTNGQADSSGVRVTAATRIPTTIMRIFGYQSIPISATSVARQNWVNTDILLVLDTTGSMNCTTSESSCSTTAAERSTSKIVALRAAVLDLYNELAEAQSNLAARGLRLRYGILPYSSAINVGRLLRAEDASYVRKIAPYYVCTSVDSAGTCLTYATDPAVNVTTQVESTSTTVWEGCIEQRQTVSTITASSGYTIPAGALDLNIDLIPHDDPSRWSAYLPDVARRHSQVACPAEAKLLQVWSTASALSTYLTTLKPNGGTYHDIGMIWGARMISPLGVFPNPSEFNGAPVSKHIIFMTDGKLDTGPDLYSSYGIERYQDRVSGNYPDGGSTTVQNNAKADLNARHRQRFLMACNAARGLDITVWTVAFATGADTTLESCAGSADRSFIANNAAELSSKFKEIGRSIGKLRIAQ